MSSPSPSPSPAPSPSPSHSPIPQLPLPTSVTPSHSATSSPSLPPSSPTPSFAPPALHAAAGPAKRKVLSFFTHITSEFSKKEQERRDGLAHSNGTSTPTPTPTPSISVTPPGLASAAASPSTSAAHSSAHSPTSAAMAALPLVLTLSHATPLASSSPLFYHNSVLTASLSLPPASLTSATYEWSRQQPQGDSLVVQSSDSPTYHATLDDVDAVISCTYRSSSASHDNATASTHQPVTLASASLSAALASFAANSAVFTVREWPSREDCTLTVRRTSLRITSSATQQLKSSFRISSTAASTTLSCALVDGGLSGRFVLSDSVTERRWEGECRDGRDECERVVLLVRRLIERPDFEWEEEVRRAEEEEKRRAAEATQRAAAEERQRQEREAEHEKVRLRLQHERDEQLARQHEQQQRSQDSQPTEAALAVAPSLAGPASASNDIATPPVVQLNAPSSAAASAASSTPTPVLPTTCTVQPADTAITSTSDALLQVHLLPPGHYNSLVALQASHAALAAAHSQLQSQLGQSQQQSAQDRSSFAQQLQSLMSDKQATHLAFERDRKALRDQLQQRDDEAKEARGDVDAVRRQLSAMSDEVGRHGAEVGRLREEVKSWKVREAEWSKEREALQAAARQREDELRLQHSAALEAASAESKRREEKAQAKLSGMEENLRKAAKELGKMKEKEARVDALEMENHKLIREIEYVREQAEGGQGKAGAAAGGAGTNGGSGGGVEQRGNGEGLGNAEWERERVRLESELRERDIRCEQLQALLDGRVREIDELHEIATQMADKEMRLDEDVARLSADVERIDSECQTLRVQREEMKGEREEREAELRRWKERVDELEGSVNYHKKKIVTLTQQIERGIKEKAGMKQAMKEELSGLTELQEEIKELRREKESVTSEMVRYRTAYNNLTLGGGAEGAAGAEAADVVEAGRSSSELSQLSSVRELVSQLTEQLSDKDEALSHMRKTNQILGVRVKELEERFKHELAKAPPAGAKR